MTASHLEDLFTFIRFPSVSTLPERKGDLVACAEWLAAKLKSIGLKSEVHPTGGHPIVIGRNEHVPGRRTVMIYGHYDVQPVDPLGEWTSPPFDPVVRDGVLYARGSTDNKGQILSHILGVQETLKEKGELPVNLIFLVEGEEEIGSKHLEAFLSAHRDQLQCDLIAMVPPPIYTVASLAVRS
jgi:acetylornithine deacetylase/succinyl-diaminopimelate desuccinylase-like protein